MEHWTARSHDASLQGEYANCLYACRFCNRSRSARPTRQGEARLLDPTRDAWGEHFAIAADHLQAVAGDGDADYTHAAYELDDPRKVARRRARRELIADRLGLLARLEGEITELLRLADLLRRRDLRRFAAVLEQIRAIRVDGRRALGDLYRYAAVPRDAPRTCRCAEPRDYALPSELDRQMLDLPELW